eukprot:COSAG01_NODE_2589_length_7411_cov_50.806482_2_plen_59_part_00
MRIGGLTLSVWGGGGGGCTAMDAGPFVEPPDSHTPYLLVEWDGAHARRVCDMHIYGRG